MQHHAQTQLNKVISQVDDVTFYGCSKAQYDVESRIRAACGSGLVPDLWDAAARFRIICDRVDQVTNVTRQLLLHYGGAAVRCRNYYLHPRKGVDDPYRGVHLELQWESEEFVEVQLLTAHREAVGQIDHPMVLKRRVPPMATWHMGWLRELSWSANVCDAMLVGVML